MTTMLTLTLGSFFINTLMAIVAWRLRWLTRSGAIAALCIGFIIFRFTGFFGWIILMLFFVTATVLGLISRRATAHWETSELQKKGGTRDWIQVLANGGIAALAALLYGISSYPHALVMYGAALAASTADTWAGEAGILSRKPPVSIRTGQPVPPGMSGGVSFLGTVSSMVGSLMIALAWYGAFATYRDTTWVFLASIIAVAGIVGSLVDSLLGATIQGHYWDPEKKQITEHDYRDGKKLELCRGIRWIDNDVVNVLSNIIATLLASGLSLIIL